MGGTGYLIELPTPVHSYCNAKALEKYGFDKTWSWMRGGVPYEDWWYFVDNPFVVRTWRVRR